MVVVGGVWQLLIVLLCRCLLVVVGCWWLSVVVVFGSWWRLFGNILDLFVSPTHQGRPCADSATRGPISIFRPKSHLNFT